APASDGREAAQHLAHHRCGESGMMRQIAARSDSGSASVGGQQSGGDCWLDIMLLASTPIALKACRMLGHERSDPAEPLVHYDWKPGHPMAPGEFICLIAQPRFRPPEGDDNCVTA